MEAQAVKWPLFTLVLILATIAVALCERGVRAQDTFQNLDFESATLVSSGGDVKLTVNRSPDIIYGCNRLDWGIQIEAAPDGHQTGLTRRIDRFCAFGIPKSSRTPMVTSSGDGIPINFTCIVCPVVINSLEQTGMGGNPCGRRMPRAI